MLENEGEREKLSHVIRRWNNSRLDLFEISQPDKDLAFQGVMRFYLEDPAGGNVATKCLRFCSNTSTREVVQALWEKFRPDLKMLSDCYRLYEMHGDTERELGPDERPLVVQLNWNSDHREGRFVLKQSKERTEESSHHKGKGGMIQTFKRSRKEKKKKKVPDGSRGNAANQTPQAPQEPPANQRQGDAPARRHTGSGHWGVLKQLGLPLGIWLSDDGGEAFVSAVINCSSSSTAHFKLSPAYALYAAGCSALRGPASSSPGRTCNVTSMANKMAAMTGEVIQRQQGIAGALAFWMANTSELLNFFQNDKDLSGLTRQSQLDLSLLVHEAYRWGRPFRRFLSGFAIVCFIPPSHLIGGLQSELQKHLPTFFMDPEQHGLLPPGTGDTPLKPCVPHAEKSCLSHRRLLSVTEMVLNTLLDTMSLLRRCRVNPTLAIQLFSQLFHFISSWLFNCLMSPDAATSGLRSHYWGAVLRQRLTGIRAWAERQGLELAADCHLGRIIQATMLLTMAKYTTQDAKHIQHTCFKLNSLQMQALLAGYFYASDEPDIPADLIDAVVTAAKASADAEIEREGRDVELEESLHLRLPFLLPEGGYSCCSVRGIPPGFREFLEPICHRGLCWFTSQHNPDADWTVFFTQTPAPAGSPSMESQREPEGVTFTLRKPPHSSLGVSIVAAKRPALSQENLCVDTGGPLLDKRQKPRQSQGAQQSTTYSQLPIRPSFSSQDISSDKSKVQQGTCTRVWRTPFSQQATPTPSIQPVRVDIPVTRALAIQANPPLTTFQQSSSVVAPRLSEILRHNYGCPIPAAKKLPLPAKHQVSITPTKQVSFQEPPTQHKQGTGPTRPKDLQEHTEAQEKLEEKPRPQDLELLEQEARKLEDKAERSAEEAQRLHKLSLEWRFQMRRQQGDDDEDADVMVMKQQLGTRAQNERTAPGNPDSNFKEKTKSLPVPKDETKDPRPGECLHGTPLFQNHLHDNTAPEKLTFKECQRLFSPPSST
ncbi:afadin isoform X7 [Dunckerocampus dactyliophorus]|uniref:afadin isoform X7 n=1 Tax=Dunckerocampus dactyliophorus TaxID=161453 RepID=UPI00240621FB|nr:afadin isoform X7 [Dunckerocampus dactyliophorus]